MCSFGLNGNIIGAPKPKQQKRMPLDSLVLHHVLYAIYHRIPFNGNPEQQGDLTSSYKDSVLTTVM